VKLVDSRIEQLLKYFTLNEGMTGGLGHNESREFANFTGCSTGEYEIIKAFI
jgi:hypothetical protein